MQTCKHPVNIKKNKMASHTFKYTLFTRLQDLQVYFNYIKEICVFMVYIYLYYEKRAVNV